MGILDGHIEAQIKKYIPVAMEYLKNNPEDLADIVSFVMSEFYSLDITQEKDHNDNLQITIHVLFNGEVIQEKSIVIEKED